MSQRRISSARLARENTELRARLAEAEETLHAIRTGEVDALLVSGVGGDQVFTLKGADHPYRMLIEDMNEGALTLTTEGVILYANRRFAEMLKAALEQVIGSAMHTWIAPADYEMFQALLRRDVTSTHCRGEITIRASDGSSMPGYFSTVFLQKEQMPGLFCLVVTDLTEQKRNDAIIAAERLARSILDQAAEAIVVCDAQGQIIRASKAAHVLCGQNPIGLPFTSAFPLQQGEDVAFSLAKFMATGNRSRAEVSLQRDGQVKNVLVSIGPLLGVQGEQIGSVVAMIDITQQREIRERLATALHEKEVLLKEIHHRIKNNLQVVMSLLRIQRREVTDPRARAALVDSGQRVEMMALAHELLYRTENMTTINAALYLQQISTQLTQIYNRPPGQVTLSVVAEEIWLSMDQAVPCGLIINELLSNSLKYAFPDGRCGTVGIALHATPPGMLTLRVWDTGVGFPADDRASTYKSLGIALVHDLVRQLRGTVVTEHATGVSVAITFPHDQATEPHLVA